MTHPTFVSSTPSVLPNWLEAFPLLEHQIGLPEKFPLFVDSVIFLDFMNLDENSRDRWLSSCVSSQRKVVVLSPTPSESEAIYCIKHGAVGYGHSLAAKARLIEMETVVRNGGLWLGAQLIQKVLKALSEVKTDTERREEHINSFTKILTGREFSVASQLALGATNAEISDVMDVSERTVKAHISSIFNKLKVKNRVELALLLNNVQPPPIQTAKSH